MLGLAGASGTGKTTLAKLFAERTGLLFIPSSIGNVFEEINYDPTVDYPFAIRAKIQELILATHEKAYAKADRMFVSDRTPLDFIAYTLADVRRENLDTEQTQWMLNYMTRCFEVTNRYFGAIAVIQPGIQISNNDDKLRPLNPAYAEHLNSLIIGLVGDRRLTTRKFCFERSVIELEKRFSILTGLMVQVSTGIFEGGIASSLH
jgi:predicted ATPase